jgi:RNA polymerase sigma factor (sigma-70 family)
MDKSLDSWFAREVLVHEAPLVRYLMRTWPAKDEIHDLRQETYLRVYEAAAKERPRSAKAFLFATARHLVVDRARRQKVVTFEAGWDLEDLNVLVDEVSPERCARADEELRALSDAFDHLPPRCRQVVWMRRVEQHSQKEVAARLGIGEAMVEKHIAKAMRRLADALFGNQPGEKPGGTARAVKEDHCAEQHPNRRTRGGLVGAAG